MKLEQISGGAGDCSVVFVHGVLSNGDRCWRSPSGAYWPALLAAADEQGALGIFDFSYETNVFSGGYNLDDAVDALTEHLRLDKVDRAQRLIFVCHSMGGIVVRRYLVRRAQFFIDSGTAFGIFLVASPSLGSEYATWLGPLARLFGHSQASALRFADDNTWLNSLDRDFLNLKEGDRLSLIGKELIEDKFLVLRKVFRRQVVEPFSGARYFGEPYKVPHSDHLSIAKPNGPEAIQHRLLCEFIDRLKPGFMPRDAGIIAQARGPMRAADVQSLPKASRERHSSDAVVVNAPPVPDLFLGREDAVRELKQWLFETHVRTIQCPARSVIAIRGWPGIGKTALAAALAHDPELQAVFPDGVIWTSLGQRANVFAGLIDLARALGGNEVLKIALLKEAIGQVAILLRDKQVLLVVDDVWEEEHGEVFKQVRSAGTAIVFTTRLPKVAEALVAPHAIHNLPPLSEQKAVELIQLLAPSVARQFPTETCELVRDLEFLPLALHVAGRLLNKEASRGWNIGNLLTELRDGAAVLNAKAPSDRLNLESETIPTVAVLLEKSIGLLDERSRECFAFLGPFAPKPATFSLAALKECWQIEDPKPVVDELIDRGLLEPVGPGRFQMHALLVTLARSLLAE